MAWVRSRSWVKASLVRRPKPGSHVAHVGGRAQPVERAAGHQLLLYCRRQVRNHPGVVDDAGHDGVNGDVPVADFLGQHLHKELWGGFAGGVDGRAGVGVDAHRGRDEDNAAPIGYVLGGLLKHEKRALHIQVGHLVEVVLGGLQHGRFN